MSALPRRALIKATVAAGGLALAQALRWLSPRAQTGSGRLHLPLIIVRPSPQPTAGPTPELTPHPPTHPTATPQPFTTPGAVPGGRRVVHVHGVGATHWDYGSNYYGDYVDQDVVNAMVDAGVTALTGHGSVDAAWRALVPGYAPGRAIAIKVNMNNCYHCDLPRMGCEDWQLALNSLIHPVNAIVHGLRSAYSDLAERDIWVYDATVGGTPPVSRRRIPSRMTSGCRYAGMRFFDTGCVEPAGYEGVEPGGQVTWRPPAGVPMPPAMRVTDVLVDATYVINLPIMRRHVSAGVTLGFKNHFGSIADCTALHEWIHRDDGEGSTIYSALVDLYQNPNIAAKTVLVVGDGLYGNWYSNTSKARPWRTFGYQAANSLLLATDPVAIDCVMTDVLHAEEPVLAMADGYLGLAAEAGLGTYERGDPWGSGYSHIDYDRLEV